jgi:hypothetical protein
MKIEARLREGFPGEQAALLGRVISDAVCAAQLRRRGGRRA